MRSDGGRARGKLFAGAPGTAAPPPIPSAGGPSYYLGVSGQQTGPFDVATLATKAKDGSLP